MFECAVPLRWIEIASCVGCFIEKRLRFPKDSKRSGLCLTFLAFILLLKTRSKCLLLLLPFKRNLLQYSSQSELLKKFHSAHCSRDSDLGLAVFISLSVEIEDSGKWWFHPICGALQREVGFVEPFILGIVCRGKTDGIFSNILLKQCNFSSDWSTSLGWGYEQRYF